MQLNELEQFVEKLLVDDFTTTKCSLIWVLYCFSLNSRKWMHILYMGVRDLISHNMEEGSIFDVNEYNRIPTHTLNWVQSKNQIICQQEYASPSIFDIKTNVSFLVLQCRQRQWRQQYLLPFLPLFSCLSFSHILALAYSHFLFLSLSFSQINYLKWLPDLVSYKW